MPPFSDNDIAILELEEELDLTEYTPICLAGTDVKESGDFIQLYRKYLLTFPGQVSELLRAGA